jgi:hypothetical protein
MAYSRLFRCSDKYAPGCVCAKSPANDKPILNVYIDRRNRLKTSENFLRDERSEIPEMAVHVIEAVPHHIAARPSRFGMNYLSVYEYELLMQYLLRRDSIVLKYQIINTLQH